tara:strand:- start:80 stop:646 length:567 start_codon:yes stop_codon:yes gene_type:complete
MKTPLIIGVALATILIFFLSSVMNSALAADTNTVSSTVVTNSTPPTANAPSVVVNNSDVCKTAASSAIQTQVLGFASGITITDENCERIKLARSLYSMGMKVAAVSLLSQDARVFDSMVMAGTPPPIFSKIGSDALDEWKKNPHLIPEGSKVFSNNKIEITKTENNNEEFKKFIIAAMAMYIGFPILF